MACLKTSEMMQVMEKGGSIQHVTLCSSEIAEPVGLEGTAIVVGEQLRRWTRNRLGSRHAGLNPVDYGAL